MFGRKNEATQERDERELLERSTLLRIERFLSARSPGFIVLTSLLLLALIGFIDSITGGFAVDIFYFFPVALVTFSRGKRAPCRKKREVIAAVLSIPRASAAAPCTGRKVATTTVNRSTAMNGSRRIRAKRYRSIAR